MEDSIQTDESARWSAGSGAEHIKKRSVRQGCPRKIPDLMAGVITKRDRERDEVRVVETREGVSQYTSLGQ